MATSAILTYATSQHIRVHGLAVPVTETETGTVLSIPSKQVTITRSGPMAPSKMRTLTPARVRPHQHQIFPGGERLQEPQERPHLCEDLVQRQFTATRPDECG